MAPKRDPTQPIAIIGMGLRLPGGVSTAEDFWSLMINKKDGRCRVPENRYKVEGFFSKTSHKETVATEYGYFLQDVNLKAFDASFFAANRYEAEMLDPQQRLLLEVVWECMENAGQANLQGTNTGVYVGSYGEDWHNLVHQDTQTSSVHRVLNTADFMLSNKISHQYDLRGPSLTIRTACSAAMTGLHLACQALYNGDCPTAIVAGSSIILGPSMTQDMTAQGMISPTGTCKTFDKAADGFARGEGVNAILIKPLEDALRDNDPIRAVIRSTAVNSSGKTTNVGLPNPESQETMIRNAYKVAGISDLSRTPFIECHGTGTLVGDPLEVAAVASVFGGYGAYIGSVKTNVGHTEGASGITGIIKAVLALEKEMIPPNINFSTPNPKIPFEKYKLQVPIDPIPWPENRHARVSVNCFGIGGANAHAIIDSAASFGIYRSTPAATITGTSANGIPKETSSRQPSENTNGNIKDGAEVQPQLLIISASSAKSLKTRVADLQRYIESRKSSLAEIAHTLSIRRVHLSHRAFCVANGADGPLEFKAFQKSRALKPEVVFVFTGQGAQWVGMGKELYHYMPSFRQDVREMDCALKGLAEPAKWTIEGMLCSDLNQDTISKAEFAQPLSTAVQLALANLLVKCGVKPSAVAGHSSGEIAAAYVAGALTMSEAIICSYLRGAVTKRQTRVGRMAAVGMSRENVSSYLVEGVQVACENSPKSVTLSGDASILEGVITAIKSKNADVFVRKLRVDMAYHSHHMREVGPEYEELLVPYLSGKKLVLPFYSTVTGGLATLNTPLNAVYWRSNLESPVLFDSAVQALLGDFENEPILIEIGPHSALQGPLRQIFQEFSGPVKPAIYLPTLLRDENSTTSILNTLGQLYSCGYAVDFSYISPTAPVLLDLPLYPWDHSKEFWNESRISHAWRSRQYPHHELLGASYPATGDSNMVWRNMLSCIDVPWLKDHMVINDIVFPCAAYVAMIGEAIRQATGSEAYTLRDLVVKSAMITRESETIEIITTMSPLQLTELTNSSWYNFSVSSFNGVSWVQHCIAQGKAGEADIVQSSAIGTMDLPLPRRVSENVLYDQMKRIGLNFGPWFRCLKNISAHTHEYMARAAIRNDEGQSGAKYAVHPVSIDACLQLSVVATSKGIARHMGSLMVPSRIGLVHASPECSELRLEANVQRDMTASQVDILAVTKESKIVVKLESVKFMRLDPGDDHHPKPPGGQTVGRIVWRPDINFRKVADTLRHANPIRDVKISLESFIVLCILRFLDVMEASGVSPPANHFAKYVSWLRKERESMLRGEYRLVPEAEQWASTDAKSRKILFEAAKEQVDSKKHHKASSIAKMCSKVVQPSSIRAIFTENVHPLQLYVEDDGLAEFYNYYSPNLDAEEFFKLSAHSQPNLKILEVGAGTAGTTAVILNHLVSSEGTRMYSEYMFTDISSGFFANAQERLKQWDGIQYKTLDITKDPVEQGFSVGEYDIVVASNVLHATPSLHQTLKHVRSLLRPGGRLYLQEHVTPSYSRVVPFITGLLSGWWLGENDSRADGPLISVERWSEELRVAGFCGLEAAIGDDDNLHRVMAHMTAVVPAPDASTKEVTFLYAKERHEFACELAAVFERDGLKVHWSRISDQEYVEGQDIISTVELEKPYFSDISEDDFASFMACLSHLKGGLLWLTRAAQIYSTDPRYGLVVGLARTIRIETSLDFWTAELQNLGSLAVDAAASIARRFLRRPSGAGRSVDCEFAFHDGMIHVGRYHWSSMAKELESQLQESDPKEIAIGQPGMLDSLYWVQRPSPALQTGEVDIDIHCTGLNFRDIIVAMGLLRGAQDNIGYEAAGVVTRVGSDVSHVKVGDRVMMLYPRLFATRRVMPGELVFRIPDELSLEDASTMIIVYSTAIYALLNKGELQKGQSVLIHSACGGVGQAALQICKMIGTETYTTVGSEEKVQYLMQNCGLPRERIFNSRNASFYDDIMRATKGRGVDLVLNSLSGDLLHTSWRCVAKWGKMMEIGKRDMVERGHLALDPFCDNRAYFGINLDGMFEHPKMLCGLMKQFLQYYAEGHIKPIQPIHAFPAHKISDAFRHMQKGQHIGKIVIIMPEDAMELSATRIAQGVTLSNTSTYLLVGGLGGLGKAVATWMAEKGARSFVFLSPSAGESAENQAFLRELESQGCSAIAVAGSVVEVGDVMRAIEAAPTPVAGVVQLSMTLRDLPLLDIGYDDWKYVQGPKVTGTWNLHKALSGVVLDFFVLFGSLSAVFGQHGQAGYSSANTFMNSFVQYRHSLGLPCSIIDVGAMEGIGTLSQAGLESQFAKLGMQLLQEQDLMDAFQLSLKPSGAQPIRTALEGAAASGYTSDGQIAIGMISTRPLADPGNRHPTRNDIRMGLALQLEQNNEQSTGFNGEGISQLLSLAANDPNILNQSSTLDQLTLEIGRTLCGFMLLPEENLDVNMTLESMGVDSLVSIEIRNWWRGTLGAEISVLEITNAGTIGRLGKLAMASLQKKHGVEHDDDRNDKGLAPLPRVDLAAEFLSYLGAFADFQGSLEHLNSPLRDEATVFLTGANGYLGSEILKQLLRHEAVGVVVVLVRAKSIKHGMDRIKETAGTLGWWTPQDEARVEVWLGDLARGQLGLQDEQLARLRGESGPANIDAIIHNGAKINFSAAYETLRAPNVESTVELLKLTLFSPVSPKFIYVSGGMKMAADQPFEVIAEELSTHFGYSQTKIMAERIVLKLASQLPAGQNRISVVKPGLIIGAADSGVTNVDDGVWLAVAAAAAIKTCPQDAGSSWLYMASVDEVATRITRQVFSTESAAFVDIADGMLTSTFWELVCEGLGFPYAGMPWEDWTQLAITQANDDALQHALLLFQHIIKDNKPFPLNQPSGAEVKLQTRFGLQSSLQYLKHIGFLQSSPHGQRKVKLERLGTKEPHGDDTNRKRMRERSDYRDHNGHKRRVITRTPR